MIYPKSHGNWQMANGRASLPVWFGTSWNTTLKGLALAEKGLPFCFPIFHGYKFGNTQKPPLSMADFATIFSSVPRLLT